MLSSLSVCLSHDVLIDHDLAAYIQQYSFPDLAYHQEQSSNILCTLPECSRWRCERSGLRQLSLTIPAGPDKKLKLSLNYPASVGRNMDEIVRCVDALQLSAKYSVATPANCEPLLMLCLHGQLVQSSLSGPHFLRGLMFNKRAGSLPRKRRGARCPRCDAWTSMPILGGRILIGQDLCACRASEP